MFLGYELDSNPSQSRSLSTVLEDCFSRDSLDVPEGDFREDLCASGAARQPLLCLSSSDGICHFAAFDVQFLDLGDTFGPVARVENIVGQFFHSGLAQVNHELGFILKDFDVEKLDPCHKTISPIATHVGLLLPFVDAYQTCYTLKPLSSSLVFLTRADEQLKVVSHR